MGYPTQVTTNIPCNHRANWPRQWKNGKGHTDMDSLRLSYEFPKRYFHFFGTWSPESATRSLRGQRSLHHIENHSLVWIYPSGIGRNRRTSLQDWAADSMERRQPAATSPAQRYRQIPQLVGVGWRWLKCVQMKQEQKLSLTRMTSTGRRQETFLWVWKLSLCPQIWAGSSAPIYSHCTERVETLIKSLQFTHTP